MIFRDQLQFGNIYHLSSRGANQEAVFKEERNYYDFLGLLKKYLFPITHVYAYCLLPTHFHIMVRIKEWERIQNCIYDESQLWMQVRTFLGTYTNRINKNYDRSGHLFEGRYCRRIFDKDPYFYDLIICFHQIPQIHGIVIDFRNWPFSSYNAYLKKDRRSLIAKEILFDDDIYQRILKGQDTIDEKKIWKEIPWGNGYF